MTNEYDDLIEESVAAWLPRYDWRLFKAQLYQESRLNPNAVSLAGAKGICQFMDDTWAEWSVKGGFPGARVQDPQAAIPVAAQYMAYLIGQWKAPRPDIDRYCLAAASYNAGLGNMLKAQQVVSGANDYRTIISGLPSVTAKKSAETIGYVKNVLQFWQVYVTG